MDVAVKQKSEVDDEVLVAANNVEGQQKATDPLADQEPKDPVTDPLVAQADEKKKPRSAGGTAAGKLEYQQTLGAALGGKLYGALAKDLSQDKMAKHAEKGVAAALESLGMQLGEVDQTIDPEGLKKFADALGSYAGEVAKEFMATESGQQVVHKVGDWVDANPEIIVAVAVLAAAGAIVANMPLPELKTKLKLGGGAEAEIGAKLGKLRAIALEQVRAKITWSSGSLKAAAEVKHDLSEEETSVKAEVSAGGKERNVTATAEVTADGLKVYGVRGLYATGAGDLGAGVEAEKGKEPVIDASLTRKDGSTTIADSVSYDSATGVLSLKNAIAHEDKESGTKAEASRTTASDGSRSAALSLSNEIAEDTTLSGGLSHEEKAGGEEANKANLALDYAHEGFSAGARGELATGDGGDSYNLGAHVGYADEENKLRAGYEYRSDKDEHKLSGLAQTNVGKDAKVRGTAALTTGPDGKKLDLGLHGLYQLNKDVGIIGGGSYQVDSKGESVFMPEVGAQVKGIPVMMGIGRDSVQLKIGIPF